MWKSTFVNAFPLLFREHILTLWVSNSVTGWEKEKYGEQFYSGKWSWKKGRRKERKESTYLRNTNLNTITWCTEETLKIAEKTALLKTASWDRTWSKISAINQQHEWKYLWDLLQRLSLNIKPSKASVQKYGGGRKQNVVWIFFQEELYHESC